MRRIIIGLLCVLFIFNITGCSSVKITDQSTLETAIESSKNLVSEDRAAFSDLRIDNEISFDELITQKLELDALIGKYIGVDNYFIPRPNLEDVYRDIGIECLRKKENGVIYSVHKIEPDGVLYLFYTTLNVIDGSNHENDTLGDYYLYGAYYVVNKLQRSDFTFIEGKDTVEDVTEIDPIVKHYKENYYAKETEKHKMYTIHYLEDGILNLHFEENPENGSLEYTGQRFYEDFIFEDVGMGRRFFVDLSVLPQDGIKYTLKK